MRLLPLALLALVWVSSPAYAVDCGELVTQAQINQCAFDMYDEADLLLNQTYKQVMAKLDPHRKAALKKAQLAWIKYRDSHCESEASVVEGGSMYPTLQYSCMRSETEKRTEQLNSMSE